MTTITADKRETIGIGKNIHDIFYRQKPAVIPIGQILHSDVGWIIYFFAVFNIKHPHPNPSPPV